MGARQPNEDYQNLQHEADDYLSIDPRALLFWKSYLPSYGAQNRVPWDEFLRVLHLVIPHMTHFDLEALRILLAEGEGKQMSTIMGQFALLIRWFGPFSIMLDKIRDTLVRGGCDWFFGSMSGADSEIRLRNLGRPGVFMVRFSKSEAMKGGFAIDVMDESGEIRHWHHVYNIFALDNQMDRGIIHYEQDGSQAPYADLPAFVEYVVSSVGQGRLTPCPLGPFSHMRQQPVAPPRSAVEYQAFGTGSDSLFLPGQSAAGAGSSMYAPPLSTVHAGQPPRGSGTGSPHYSPPVFNDLNASGSSQSSLTSTGSRRGDRASSYGGAEAPAMAVAVPFASQPLPAVGAYAARNDAPGRYEVPPGAMGVAAGTRNAQRGGTPTAAPANGGYEERRAVVAPGPAAKAPAPIYPMGAAPMGAPVTPAVVNASPYVAAGTSSGGSTPTATPAAGGTAAGGGGGRRIQRSPSAPVVESPYVNVNAPQHPQAQTDQAPYLPLVNDGVSPSDAAYMEAQRREYARLQEASAKARAGGQGGGTTPPGGGAPPGPRPLLTLEQERAEAARVEAAKQAVLKRSQELQEKQAAKRAAAMGAASGGSSPTTPPVGTASPTTLSPMPSVQVQVLSVNPGTPGAVTPPNVVPILQPAPTPVGAGQGQGGAPKPTPLDVSGRGMGTPVGTPAGAGGNYNPAAGTPPGGRQQAVQGGVIHFPGAVGAPKPLVTPTANPPMPQVASPLFQTPGGASFGPAQPYALPVGDMTTPTSIDSASSKRTGTPQSAGPGQEPLYDAFPKATPVAQSQNAFPAVAVDIPSKTLPQPQPQVLAPSSARSVASNPQAGNSGDYSGDVISMELGSTASNTVPMPVKSQVSVAAGVMRVPMEGSPTRPTVLAGPRSHPSLQVDPAASLRTSVTPRAQKNALWTWGFSTGADPSPLFASDDCDLVSISSGSSHSVARGRDNSIWAWGDNKFGRCLQAASVKSSIIPQRASAPLDTVQAINVCAAKEHTFVVTSTGAVYAVGFGDKGRLGLDDRKNRTTPTVVPALSVGAGSALAAGETTVAVTSWGNSSAALTSAGSVLTWGRSDTGQLGQGAAARANGEVRVPTRIDAATCWGAATTVISVAMADTHCVFLTKEGSVYTCGQGEAGELGQGDVSECAVPQRVAGLNDVCVASIAVGKRHTLALAEDGTVYAWGDNSCGQLGLGDVSARAVPTKVSALDEASIGRVHAGPECSAFVSRTGELYTCGTATHGLLGRPTAAVPATIPGPVPALAGRSVVAVAIGDAQMVALVTDTRELADLSLTEKYWRDNVLDYNDLVTDIFYDVGRAVAVLPALPVLIREPVHWGREVLLVDLEKDVNLREMVQRVRALTNDPAMSEVARVKAVAKLVSDRLGGVVNPRLVELSIAGIRQLKADLQSNVVPIGMVQYGLCRHRSILFKVLADSLRLPCRLLRGVYADPDAADGGAHAWNVVFAEGAHRLVDVMYEPSEIHEVHSQAAQRYHRMSRTSEGAVPSLAGVGGNSINVPAVGGGAGAGAAPVDVHMTRPSVEVPQGGAGTPGGASAAAVITPPSAGSRATPRSAVETPHIELDQSEIRNREKIGEGGFGIVERAEWAGITVAVKRMNTANLTDEMCRDFIAEIGVIKSLRHPCVVQFLAAGTHPPDLFIVTEYVSRGSLWALFRDQKTQITWQQSLGIARHTAAGMGYLHNHALIIHRDLKSPNILISADWAAKVADFGLSRVRLAQSMMTQRHLGSYQWMAPELFLDVPYSDKVDVYAFGIVMWELATRAIPFQGEDMMTVVNKVVYADARPPVPASCPRGFADLMRECWRKMPADRPTFAQVIERLRAIE